MKYADIWDIYVKGTFIKNIKPKKFAELGIILTSLSIDQNINNRHILAFI